MLNLYIASSLAKILPTHTPADLTNFTPAPVMRGECFSFHAGYCAPNSFLKERCRATVSTSLEGDTPRVYSVDPVPVRVPCYPDWIDDDYITTTPGIIPDIMRRVEPNSDLYASQSGMNMLRVELDVPYDAAAGEYEVSLTLTSCESEESVTEHVKFEVLAEKLPPQETVVMHWLHADCIANYYGLEALSDTHFEYIEKAVKTAVENGVNALLTPVFTPPLDTAVGGERLTVQLVDVYRRDGEWSFDYGKLDRWCDMALRCGVEYFEVSHLFTQWGASHAPKIIAEVDGERRQVFGWDTDAAGDEYVLFLRSFLESFIAHMKERGLDGKCIFHISDEPSSECEESYRSAANSVRDILKGYTVADALSDFSYYEKGLCQKPIPGIDHAAEFLDAIPEGLWVYYCCSQALNVSNRFMAMPLSRVRIIGVQMWKYRATGFLHWGYNFYNSQYSMYSIDPYRCTDGDFFVPAGDTFSVYPAEDGEVLTSVRMRAFYEALCDIRALDAAAAKCGRDAVLRAVDEGLSHELTFTEYPRGEEYLLDLRKKIGEMLR